jgi:protein-S-isoprenylcysteine O-methyltransferase
MPSRPAEEGSLTGPDKSLFSFENDPPETITTMATPGKLSPSEGQVFGRTDTSIADLELPRTGTTESDTKVEPSQALSTQNWQNKPQSDVEQEYLRKATMYISALPSGVNTDAHTVKIVLSKLHNSYAPDIKLSPHDDVERLRARYVFAVVNYLNEKLKLNPEPATVEFIKDVLRDSDGDLLRFCATLVEKDYISLGNLDHVVGLCSNILNVLPKSEATAATAEPQPVVASSVSTVPTTPSGDISKTVPTDPVEGMKAWPTQQKREHGM